MQKNNLFRIERSCKSSPCLGIKDKLLLFVFFQLNHLLRKKNNVIVQCAVRLFKFSRTGKPLCKVNLFLLFNIKDIFNRTIQHLNKNKPVIIFLKN